MKTEELVRAVFQDTVALRRQIHRNPELPKKEYETTALVKRCMAEYGIEVADIGLETGVLAIIRGKKPGKTIALREDMDALPMQEKTGLPFASQNEGACHSCGHDIHTAILLGTARILAGIREELAGNVMLIFQPAEEAAFGARQFVEHEFYKVLKPDLFLGCHVNPAFTVGDVGTIRGAASASSDSLKVTVKGVGGHGAHPENSVDPIVASAYIITALQTVIARENDPQTPAVLTMGSIHAGKAGNVIPDEVEMVGTLRNLDPEARERNKAAATRIIETTAEALRCTAEVRWGKGGCPVRVHGDEAVDLVEKAAAEVLGEEHVKHLAHPSMGSEDFGHFFPKFGPGMQFALGTGNADKATRFGIHNPENIFDEESIAVGMKVLVQAARDYLS